MEGDEQMKLRAGEATDAWRGISYITRSVFVTEPDLFHGRGGRSCGRGERKVGLELVIRRAMGLQR